MRNSASLLIIFFTHFVCGARAMQHLIGVLADLQLGFPETDMLAAVAVMACRHIQNRDNRLVSSQLSADFNITCNIVDHSFQSRTQVAEAALHWSAIGADFMVGAYSSEASGSLAVMGSLHDIPVVGFWAASETLSDKQVYSYFGRSNPSAVAVPRAVLKFISAMGWENFGYIFHDDTTGNSFNNAFYKYAHFDGVKIQTSQQYTRDDRESIRAAVKGLASSGVTIFVVAAASRDALMILEAADEFGIIGRGYSWFGSLGQPESLIVQSKNATRTLELISGWLTIESNPFAEDSQWRRFDEVWKSETFESVEIADVNSVVRRPLPSTVNDRDCFHICGYMYDAVWTAALSLDRSLKAEDGDVEAAQVLAAWSMLEFQGATGRVHFDEKRDRGAGVPLVVYNWVPVETSDGVSIKPTEIAQWDGTSDKLQLLEFPDKSVPAWAGGGRGWDAVPADGSACAPGHVVSLVSLQCEPCPAGAFQNGSSCELCRPGYHAPDAGTVQCLPCLQSGYAEREGMMVCTPCEANYEMRGGAQASTSDADCVCRSGFIAGCQWPVWQVLAVVMAAVVVAKLVHTAVRRSAGKQAEQEVLAQRVRLLRGLLRLRREHGFMLPGERPTWVQWLGFAPHRAIRVKPLKHLAMLTLLRRFDLEAVDSLGMLFQAMVEQDPDEPYNADSSLHNLGALSPRPLGAGGLEPGGLEPGGLEKKAEASPRWQTLCNIIIHVSCQLLDPHNHSLEVSSTGTASASGGPVLDGVSAGAGSHDFMLVAVPNTLSAEERFTFFRDQVAKLQLWEQRGAFAALKERLQASLDALRSEMDKLHALVVAEDGGSELVAWAPVVEHREVDGAGPIQRQDHVMAIRFDEHARKQATLLHAHARPMRVESSLAATIAPFSPFELSGSPVGSAAGFKSGARSPLSGKAGLGQCLSQLERQFVEQLHLQADLLDESFQQAVRDSLSARAFELDKAGRPDAGSAHVQVSAGAIKTVKRMLEKVRKYAEDARGGKAELSEPFTGHVLDPVRASVICRNSRELLETAKWMLDNGARCSLPVVRVKNKFAVKDATEYDGYRDLMLSVLHAGPLGLRIVGELQFHDERMYALKVQMHRLYKVKRAGSAASI